MSNGQESPQIPFGFEQVSQPEPDLETAHALLRRAIEATSGSGPLSDEAVNQHGACVAGARLILTEAGFGEIDFARAYIAVRTGHQSRELTGA